MAARLAACRHLLRATTAYLPQLEAQLFSSCKETFSRLPSSIATRNGTMAASVAQRTRVATASAAASPVVGSATVGAPLGDHMPFDVVSAVGKHLDRVAVVAGGDEYTYGAVLGAAVQLAEALRAQGSVSGERVALLAQPGVEFVVGTWACWLCSATCVPLAISHPPAELEYVLHDAGVTTVLAHSSGMELLKPLADGCSARVLPLPDVCSTQLCSEEVGAAASLIHGTISPHLGSLIIYTSGTTGRPKGVLHTRGSIAAQVASLSTAWEWQAEDRILHSLPLHHIHGLVNALQCAHAVGATVEFISFSASHVWERLRSGEISVFMGVPTVYSMLLTKYDKMSAAERAAAGAAAQRLRLTVSGSAACPLVVMEQWERLSGQRLLERYGMTEIGMALSNVYTGERRPGYVGLPLPGVEVKMVQTAAGECDGAAGDEGGDGELCVRGPQLFREYWGRPDATSEAFDEDGFFRTGDTVQLSGTPPFWKIVGRTSVDIIKYSGYKILALDIENKLLQHPSIRECAVVGIADEVRGQLVGAVVGLHEGEELSVESLSAWCKDKMPPYHIPKQLTIVKSIPRNAMGKINKKQLVKDMFPAVP